MVSCHQRNAALAIRAHSSSPGSTRLDPDIHRLGKKLDCRVKPGNDGQYS
jgi:hypothetical protein